MGYEEEEQRYLLHTYKRNYTNFVSGHGTRLIDESGKEYIDFFGGIAVNSVGYANEALKKTVCDAINGVHHISNLFYIPSQAEAAKKIHDLCGMDVRIFFGNSGAEANEGAIKIARKYGERFEKARTNIITIENSFHGRTIATLAATAQEKMHAHFGAFPDGFITARDIDEAISLIDNETAAVMLEPIQAEGGVAAFEKEEFQRLRAVTKQKNVLLICDEVQTGVFRSGEFLACSVYGVQPDIFTLAKGLAGGVPIGAVATTLTDIFEPGDHGSTFGGNPLSTKAACTVLDILSEEKTSGRLAKKIALFTQKADEIVAAHQSLFVKRTGFGLLIGLKTKNDEIMNAIIKQAFIEGVIVIKSAQSTVRLLPPIVIGHDDITEGFVRLERALSHIKA